MSRIIPLIVDGEDVVVEDVTFPVYSAASNTSIALAGGASIEVANRTVDAAEKAFAIWRATSPQERRRLLQKFGEVIESQAEDLICAMMEETSCTRPYAEHNIRESVAVIMETAALATAQALEGSIPSTSEPNCLALVLHEPLGVILSIAPWNAALILGVRAFLGALVAGNAVVLKGSELCPRTHYIMIRAIQTAGFPPGVVSLLQHRPEDASKINTALIAHRAVRKVTFTGSTRVGAIIASTAAKHLKPTLMELGGKCPMIVLEDADFAAAAEAAVIGGFLNNGQICMSTELVIVIKTAEDKMIQALRTASQNFPQRGLSVTANGAQRTLRLVEDAINKGASLEGHDQLHNPESLLDGASLPQMIIRNLKPEMKICHDETFGPCLGVIVADSVSEAVAIANNSAYGLSASVFSSDTAKAIAIAKQLTSGAVHINAMTLHDEATLPHGGLKNSGYGRFGGRWGLSEFVQTKNIMVHGVAIA